MKGDHGHNHYIISMPPVASYYISYFIGHGTNRLNVNFSFLRVMEKKFSTKRPGHDFKLGPSKLDVI